MAESYPMSTVTLSMHDFLLEVGRIKTSIDSLPALTSQLSTAYASNQAYQTESTSGICAAFSSTSKTIAVSIRQLAVDAAHDHNANKQTHVNRLKNQLITQMQNFRRAEHEIRQNIARDFERQFRIAWPTSTDEEISTAVQEALSSPSPPQIFSTATLRRTDAQSTLSNVQSRHTEIEKLEATIVQLSELFAMLDAQIEETQVPVDHIEKKAEEVEVDLKKSVWSLRKAVDSARRARHLKWWCLLIVLLIILIVVGIVLAWYFTVGPGGHHYH